MMKILKDNGPQFLRGTGMTLLILHDGNHCWVDYRFVNRCLPDSSRRLKINSLLDAKLPLVGSSMSTLIFRGTPMIVQSMVIFYGSASLQHFLGSYPGPPSLSYPSIPEHIWSEIVRGGILAVIRGQFEAATVLRDDPWTDHAQGRPSTGCSQYLTSNRE